MGSERRGVGVKSGRGVGVPVRVSGCSLKEMGRHLKA